MHLGFMATGIKHEMDFFEKWWETRTFPMPFTTPDGVSKIAYNQMQLRPVRLYELIFPRDTLDMVLNTLKPELEWGGAISKIPNLQITALRKLMKYNKIPTPDASKGEFPFPLNLNVRKYGIGIREDVDLTFNDGSKHEGI